MNLVAYFFTLSFGFVSVLFVIVTPWFFAALAVLDNYLTADEFRVKYRIPQNVEYLNKRRYVILIPITFFLPLLVAKGPLCVCKKVFVLKKHPAKNLHALNNDIKQRQN